MSPFCFSWPPNGSIVNKWSRIVKTAQRCFSKWIEIKVTWVKFWKLRVKLGTISFLHLVTLPTKSKAFCQLDTVHGKWELLNLDLFSNLNIDHKLQIHWMPLICFSYCRMVPLLINEVALSKECQNILGNEQKSWRLDFKLRRLGIDLSATSFCQLIILSTIVRLSSYAMR